MLQQVQGTSSLGNVIQMWPLSFQKTLYYGKIHHLIIWRDSIRVLQPYVLRSFGWILREIVAYPLIFPIYLFLPLNIQRTIDWDSYFSSILSQSSSRGKNNMQMPLYVLWYIRQRLVGFSWWWMTQDLMRHTEFVETVKSFNQRSHHFLLDLSWKRRAGSPPLRTTQAFLNLIICWVPKISTGSKQNYVGYTREI